MSTELSDGEYRICAAITDEKTPVVYNSIAREFIIQNGKVIKSKIEANTADGILYSRIRQRTNVVFDSIVFLIK